MVERSIATEPVAARVRLKGHVQGIGVRPAIVNLARRLNLCGDVCNDRDGVLIFLQGREEDLIQFHMLLEDSLPCEAEVVQIDWAVAELLVVDSFEIVQTKTRSFLATPVPRDRKVCNDCLNEVFTTSDRRRRYAFTSCTHCGPRFSIIARMPYERSQTTMSAFALCPECEREYTDSADRRFHAQTNACSRCGPGIEAVAPSLNLGVAGDAALQLAAKALRQGKIVALKGIGGYQLLVDASNESAVDRLRRLKERPAKPLAVMIPYNVSPTWRHTLTQQEHAALEDWANPIVITDSSGLELAPSVTNGLKTVGVLVPTTPLHALLLRESQRPLVATSGNRDGDPLAVTPEDAELNLEGIADLWLHHNRDIAHPIDDSVVKMIRGRQVTIRLARGLAPLPLDLPSHHAGLALGGHQAVAIAVSNGAISVLGPHIGDLDSLAMRERFTAHIKELTQLYDSQPKFIACDLHPDYFSSRWAQQARWSSVKRLIRVQHHHAHIAAGMIEHGWHAETVLGIAFDGTGYGTDGAIWGGEFLRASLTDFERVGHLRSFVLPGGEVAIHQPWRVALSLVSQVMGFDDAVRKLCNLIPPTIDIHNLRPLLVPSPMSPTTTSAGRLFDGVAALALGIANSGYDGEPAMRLEDACDGSNVEGYPMPLTDGVPFEIDWRKAIQAIVQDAERGISRQHIAERFHRGLADAIATACRRYPCLRIVLGGGVFQNRRLVEMLAAEFPNDRLGLPGIIPPNDGGLAAGQLAVASSRWDSLR